MSKADTKSLFAREILQPAIIASFTKLNPLQLIKNPVMFCVEVVALLATCMLIVGFISHSAIMMFTLQITLWLWFTILFGNFAEGIAEGKGKAQASSLRQAKSNISGKRLLNRERFEYEIVAGEDLLPDDLVLVQPGDIIPGDGDIIEGMASIDESAITGESAPVIRESGGDKCAVTAGTRVISDQIIVSITSSPGNSFLDKMINLVEGAKRKKTPNEIALSILLAGATLIFILTTCSLEAFAHYNHAVIPVIVLLALFVTLIPTTIAGLLSAIGISGMDRLLRANVIALSGRAVEAAGNVDTLLLDKTGTITLGNRFATEFLPVRGVKENELAVAAFLSSLSDETPEGRSIIKLAKEQFDLSADRFPIDTATFVPFSAYTRMSGVDINDKLIRKGAIFAILKHLEEHWHAAPPEDLDDLVYEISKNGGTPLVVCEDQRVLGVIHLKDIVKADIRDRFAELREMGIRTVMITGDNSITAAAIAAEAGVDDFLAQATPETKLNLIKQEQSHGKMVAMCGDGTNDAPALAQADVGLAMATGTTAAREAGNMVDLDSNPTKLIDIVKIGKQILMTRGSLTTFSITNDVAKYFAVIPALFIGIYPQLNQLNIMHLKSPQSAILSAVIFNALIIICLIPMALKGVKYKMTTAAKALRRNLLIYGLGGMIVPFIGIKLIDILINLL